jgi:hypothetical protein
LCYQSGNAGASTQMQTPAERSCCSSSHYCQPGTK